MAGDTRRVLRDAPSKDYLILTHLLNDTGGLYRQADSTDCCSVAWWADDVFVGQCVMDSKDWLPQLLKLITAARVQTMLLMLSS